MLGSIIGDICGSHYEFNNNKNIETIQLFHPLSSATDDTVLTIAVADSIFNNLSTEETASIFKEYAELYPNSGFGGMFKVWVGSDTLEPYNSFGNGSAMRTSPCAYAYNTIEEVLQSAEKMAAITHNHPDGIKGAKAVAGAIFIARDCGSRTDIKDFVTSLGYDLSGKIDDIRPNYKFDETCEGSVPQAILAFLESNSFEHAIKLAISIGGDSDTIACITGGIAEAYYEGIPAWMVIKAVTKLDQQLLQTYMLFSDKYISPSLLPETVKEIVDGSE